MENKLKEIFDGIEENHEGYLEYYGDALSPHFHKWSDGHREKVEKEILKHYISRSEVEEIKDRYLKDYVHFVVDSKERRQERIPMLRGWWIDMIEKYKTSRESKE